MDWYLSIIIFMYNLCIYNVTACNKNSVTAQSGVSIMLMMVGFAGHDSVTAITLFTVAVSLSTFLFSGYNINHLDLSPNYSGVLMGIGNSFESISSVLAPLSVGCLISDNVNI